MTNFPQPKEGGLTVMPKKVRLLLCIERRSDPERLQDGTRGVDGGEGEEVRGERVDSFEGF